MVVAGGSSDNDCDSHYWGLHFLSETTITLSTVSGLEKDEDSDHQGVEQCFALGKE